MRVLVTDLDGTLLAGEPADRRRLRAILGRHREIVVVFASGRGVAGVRAALDDPLTPPARWIVADVGATVIDGRDLSTVESVQSQLRAGWVGAPRVRAALGAFPALVYQRDVAQAGRCSFYARPSDVTDELIAVVEALGCSWTYSANRYFDVLPPGASKGRAVQALARAMGWPMDAVLVAGDSLNDRSLFECGAHGVIVANAESALLAAVPEHAAIVRSELPGAAAVLAALQTLGWVHGDVPLVIGYHRPPMHWTAQRGWHEPSSPNGILPTLNRVLTRTPDGVWVTAGAVDRPEASDNANGHGFPQALSFVPISATEWAGFVHQACKETLWPVLMSEPKRLRFDPAAWAMYRMINERFAHAISRVAATDATVWLHDYNLWLVPGSLRVLRPDLRLGLFHHTPFPAPDVFGALPIAGELRDSLSALHWAGFHTAAFAENFRRLFQNAARMPRTGVHPLGVDHEVIGALARTLASSVAQPTHPCVLSVERLDYAKAPVRKVDALSRLLEQRPDLRGRLQFRLVCAPPERGITAYTATRQTLEQRIEKVNCHWATPGWKPIDYVPRRLPFSDIVRSYLAADVLWITSLQDGMNLTAKEFVAAHAAVGRSGVLVLSRYAGAVGELAAGALVTDPTSPADLVEKLSLALDLSEDERRTRMKHMASAIRHNAPHAWAEQIVRAINEA